MDLSSKKFLITNGLRHVAATQHIGKCHNLFLTAAHLAGFFKIALGADIADDALPVEFLLETSQSPFGRLAFAYLYF